MTTRKQHYVWRHYLRPWAQNEKIWCWRLGKIFNSNLMGVGQQRDFYKLEELTENDIDLIKKIAIDNTKNQLLREANEGWINTFQQVFRIKNFFESRGLNNPEAEKMFKELVIELEEQLHGHIEGDAQPYLKKIMTDDLTLFEIDEEYSGFCHFLATQYLRTSKIKENLIDSCEGMAPGFTKRAMGVLRHIYSTNIAWSTFSGRETFRPCLLINNTEAKFIAGDQPVINTHAAETGYLEAVSEVEFFYPFSPERAVIVSKKEVYSGGSLELELAQVHAFNALIVKSAHEQIYAAEESDFSPYLDVLSERL
nr:DUF4238 domain-containing protein [uncultured Pseudomonas sp.]